MHENLRTDLLIRAFTKKRPAFAGLFCKKSIMVAVLMPAVLALLLAGPFCVAYASELSWDWSGINLDVSSDGTGTLSGVSIGQYVAVMTLDSEAGYLAERNSFELTESNLVITDFGDEGGLARGYIALSGLENGDAVYVYYSEDAYMGTADFDKSQPRIFDVVIVPPSPPADPSPTPTDMPEATDIPSPSPSPSESPEPSEDPQPSEDPSPSPDADLPLIIDFECSEYRLPFYGGARNIRYTLYPGPGAGEDFDVNSVTLYWGISDSSIAAINVPNENIAGENSIIAIPMKTGSVIITVTYYCPAAVTHSLKVTVYNDIEALGFVNVRVNYSDTPLFNYSDSDSADSASSDSGGIGSSGIIFNYSTADDSGSPSESESSETFAGGATGASDNGSAGEPESVSSGSFTVSGSNAETQPQAAGFTEKYVPSIDGLTGAYGHRVLAPAVGDKPFIPYVVIMIFSFMVAVIFVIFPVRKKVRKNR